MTSQAKAIGLLAAADLPGGITQSRIDKLSAIADRITTEELARLRVEVAARTGKDPDAFAWQSGRDGRAEKIGMSRARGGVDIWAVWS